MKYNDVNINRFEMESMLIVYLEYDQIDCLSSKIMRTSITIFKKLKICPNS